MLVCRGAIAAVGNLCGSHFMGSEEKSKIFSVVFDKYL